MQMPMFEGLKQMMASLASIPVGVPLPADLAVELQSIIDVTLIHLTEHGHANTLPDVVKARILLAYLREGPAIARTIACCPLSKREGELVALQVVQLCALIDLRMAGQPTTSRILH